MRSGLAQFIATSVTLAAVATGAAWAGPALDESSPPPPPAPGSSAEVTPVGNAVEYGAAFRLRSVRVPRAILELFVERAADGASNIGYGIELVRRRGTSELQLGFEFERIAVGQGVWIKKGENVAAGDEADFVLSPESSGKDLGWFTIEFTFMNHAEINKYVSFRYGAGLGLGIIIGELHHNNIICVGATNSTPEPGCVPSRFGGQGIYSEPTPGMETNVAYDLGTPVFPVLNGILGFQFKPTEKLVINLEGGIRTMPFFGISSGYFF